MNKMQAIVHGHSGYQHIAPLKSIGLEHYWFVRRVILIQLYKQRLTARNGDIKQKAASVCEQVSAQHIENLVAKNYYWNIDWILQADENFN